jgi:glycosyltransferase involved in cell wall biosynthesis
MQRKSLSVIVTTRNEAENLPACLESVAWADEVLVVDSGSTDATGEIAARHGARVLVHPYHSAGAQKNWALQQVPGPWVLILDADERVSPELAPSIRAVLEQDGPLDGYFLRRQSYFLGHRIRFCGWRADRVLRLFRLGHGLYDDRLVHETLQLQGQAGQLRAPLLHYTYRSFSDYLDKLDRYSERGAADLREAGRRPSVPALLTRPAARFLRMYVLQLGFLDGVWGLLLCTLASHSVWLKYARLYEPRRADAGSATPATSRPVAAATATSQPDPQFRQRKAVP